MSDEKRDLVIGRAFGTEMAAEDYIASIGEMGVERWKSIDGRWLVLVPPGHPAANDPQSRSEGL